MREGTYRRTILICANSYPPNFIGGAELVAHNQAKALKEKGNEVIVFAGENASDRPRHAVIEDEYEGLKIYRIKLTYEDFDVNFINFKNKEIDRIFFDILQKHKPDVVHFHNIIGLSLGMIEVAKKERVKTVLSIHDHWGYCFKNTMIKSEDMLCSDSTRCDECMPYVSHYGKNIPISVRKDYFSYIMPEVDAFISSSQYFVESYIKNGISSKISNIWNGIDVEKLNAIEKKGIPGKVRFTYIGYFGKHKGVKVLLEAITQIQDKDKIIINLVGAGDQEEAYRLFIDKNNLKQQIKFWGRVPYNEMARVHSETDVYVLPSIWPENQPLSLTEGMGVGIPAIASNRGGNLEIIEDGIDGFLFNPENVSELVDKMQVFIEDRDKLKEMGRMAKRKMSDKSFSNQVDEIIKVYESIDNETTLIEEKRKIVVGIISSHISLNFVSMFNRIKKEKLYRDVEFILEEWIDETKSKEVDILIVMDNHIRIEDVIKYIMNGTCLVVNELNEELTALVRKMNSGLYYIEERDLEKELEWLLKNKIKRNIMGNNSLRFIQEKVKSQY